MATRVRGVANGTRGVKSRGRFFGGPAVVIRFLRVKVKGGGLMIASASGMERLVSLLGGWPEHFKEDERKHGESLLALLRRDKTIDEAVFGMVVRYATHRAAYDRLSVEISEQEFEATASNYLSGKEQSRAFHENKLLTLERELLATPYARVKNGFGGQTSFMDLLDDLPPEGGGTAKVMPFKPMAKKSRV